MKNRELLKRIAIDALFFALIAIFTFTPYIGFITLGPVSFTTIHVIVLLGAILYGAKRGALYGFFFGLMSLVNALTRPGTGDFIFVNPFISILPRVLFGLIAGLVFDLLRKHTKPKTFNFLAFPLCGVFTFLHTVLTLLSMYVFGILDIFKISAGLGLGEIIDSISSTYPNLWAFFGGFLALGSIGEIAIAIIIVPTIYIIIYNKYVRKEVY